MYNQTSKCKRCICSNAYLLAAAAYNFKRAMRSLWTLIEKNLRNTVSAQYPANVPFLRDNYIEKCMIKGLKILLHVVPIWLISLCVHKCLGSLYLHFAKYNGSNRNALWTAC